MPVNTRHRRPGTLKPFPPRVLLRSEQSGGQVAVIDLSAPAGFAGPPLHVHDFDETFYILEGEVTFQLGDELITAGPGDVAFVPRGVRHTFANMSEAPARYLLVCTPAGFEHYVDRIAAEQTGTEPPPEASKPIPEVTVVGPRMGDRRET